MSDKLTENEDFYTENGLVIFTRNFLLKRGYCCNFGCRHCPYKTSKGSHDNRNTEIRKENCP
jgi:hypothetical protein